MGEKSDMTSNEHSICSAGTIRLHLGTVNMHIEGNFYVIFQSLRLHASYHIDVRVLQTSIFMYDRTFLLE